jgi:nitrite reductase (NO-forming)
MRKIIYAFSLVIFFTACKSEKAKKEVTNNVEIGAAKAAPINNNEVEAKTTSLEQKNTDGKAIYMKVCFACHQAEGQGIPGAFPPLAKSDYLNADVNRAIDIILHGKTGEITVNGKTYNSIMTKQNLSDEEVANVLTYVYNNWGNSKKTVTASMVKTRRGSAH